MPVVVPSAGPVIVTAGTGAPLAPSWPAVYSMSEAGEEFVTHRLPAPSKAIPLGDVMALPVSTTVGVGFPLAVRSDAMYMTTRAESYAATQRFPNASSAMTDGPPT